MKIQRTSILLLTIAALLGGVTYLTVQNATQQEETAAAQKLFPFQEGDVQALTIQTPLQRTAFVKVPSPAKASPAPATWQMTEPEKAAASDGSIAFLLNLLGTGTSEKTLTVPGSRLAEFGFDTPQATIDITLTNQQKHRLVLGNPDFNRSFLYAQVDPPANPTQAQTIHLVSLDFENAVNRPIAEWKQQAADKPQLPPPPPPSP
jgi:hypothetical protein